MKKQTVISNFLLILVILAVFNLILQRFVIRLDFTADGQYTLSKASKEVLKNLDEVITVTAYFSDELPQQLVKYKEDFKNQLTEYRAISGGNIEFKFINPNQSEEQETVAQQKGISPMLISVNENDKVQQMRAYMGLTMEKGNKTELITSIIQPLQSGVSMEYALISAIRKLSIKNKSSLAFLQGFGEAKTQEFEPVLKELRSIYEVEEYSPKNQEEIPTLYKSLIWLAPKDTLPSWVFEKIDTYLSKGGKLFLAFDAFQNSSQPQMGNFVFANPEIGMRTWLKSKGLQVDSALVIDTKCGQVMAVQDMGGFRMQVPVLFPYMVVASNTAKHPTTEGLEGVYLSFVPALSVAKDNSAYSILPLLLSSEQTGRENPPFGIDINRKWTKADFGEGEKVLAALLEQNQSRIIVLPSAQSFLSGGQQQQQLAPDNLNFALNSIEWLSDDSGLMEVRNKVVTTRPIQVENLTDAGRETIKYFNLLLPVVLILIYSLVRRSQYQAKKSRWLEGKF
jgi:gliding-associated putative ABC transporter substrate-binding component GldG